jgi:hypothetical protein
MSTDSLSMNVRTPKVRSKAKSDAKVDICDQGPMF